MPTPIPVHDFAKGKALYTARKLKPFQAEEEREEAHRHTYYEILVFVKGKGSQMLDFEHQALRPGSIHLIAPGQVHALNRSKDLEGYVINFTKDFMLLYGGELSILDDLAGFRAMNMGLKDLDATDFQEILNLVKQMQPERTANKPMREALLAAYINLLLMKCKSIYLSSPQHKKPRTAGSQLGERFNSLLEEHYLEEHLLGFYAEKLNLSPNYLSAALKKSSGKTAGELIQQRLLLEAKRMLLYSSASIKEIAYHLNFTDPPYFTRFFKHNTGHSPELFRMEMRKKYKG